MKIAVEGCAHGELDLIYDAIYDLERRQNIKIDLLICCGDFQATRNRADLECMAVPPKYRKLHSFHRYYNGEKEAPILTIFIGGNHEASNYLQELPYGGWVAPNIYYLGYAGIVNIAGIRIGGLSGIYKAQDYLKGRCEIIPYTEGTKRSVYHIRNLEVFRLKQLVEPIDIFLSHDWPSGIWNHGDVDRLLHRKPFFRDDIESNRLGSKPATELLELLKPNHWFAAHMHCRFPALVKHSDEKTTNFLALDKCVWGRNFLEIVDVPHDPNNSIELSYDMEWLGILHSTNHLLSTKPYLNYMPGDQKFPLSEETKSLIQTNFGDMKIPANFTKTAVGHDPFVRENLTPSLERNPQTEEFCRKLQVNDPIQVLAKWEINQRKSPDLDSKEDELETPPAKKSLTPMNLPTPQHDSLPSEGDKDDSVGTNLPPNNSTSVNDMKSELSQETESADQIVNPVSVSEPLLEEADLSETDKQVTNSPRGFKRRNASLYS